MAGLRVKLLYISILAMAVMSCLLFFGSKDTEACCVSLNPNPNTFGKTIPDSNYNQLRKADEYSQTPALTSWVSDAAPPATNFAKTTINNVSSGTKNIDLSFSNAGAVGFIPSQVTRTKHIVTNASGTGGTIKNLIGDTLLLDWRPDYNKVGTYRHDSSNFVYNKPDGFTKSGTYRIFVVTKSINEFRRSNGSLVYRCVPSGQDVSSFSDFGSCPTTGWSFYIYIDVPPKGDYQNKVKINGGTKYPVDGIVEPGKTYSLYPQVNNSGPETTYGVQLMGVQNVDKNKVNNAGINDLTPAGNRANIFGVEKSYTSNNASCSPNADVPRDCWSWAFEDLQKNKLVNAELKFKVKNDVSDGDQVCFLPFVRRRSLNQPVHIGEQVCFTVGTTITICPDGTDFAGDKISELDDNNNDGEINSDDCNLPPELPYVSFYGNDILTGSQFYSDTSKSCTLQTPDTADVRTFYNQLSENNYVGASSQLAAFVKGDIDINNGRGFFTANQRNGASPKYPTPSPATGLTGGNFDGSSIVNQGGGDSGVTHCLPNLFDEASKKPANQFSSLIGSGNISNGDRRTIYLEGDVYINKNITYTNESNWSSISQIPNLRVVVKGNIFIGPSVHTLDGTYIAVPEDDGTGNPSGGEIFTCANSTGPFSNSEVLAQCKNKLTINGALVGFRVHLLRARGDLNKTARPNEPASDPDIAEVFNFSPESYIVPLDPSSSRDVKYKKYDYITSLPPIL